MASSRPRVGYVHGKEHGPWRDYHENGQLAAEGEYADGVEVGTWHYWDARGAPSAD
jgi:antitoxin component YwqK of YwqJK toxin-antitoxin module